MTNALITLLIPVLIQVESGGNNKAVGKAGELGCLQIMPCVIEDVNRIYGYNYVHTDALDRRHSEDICYAYLAYWGAKFKQETNASPTYEVYARMWNGGPRGWDKKSTEQYWRKVEDQILAQAEFEHFNP